MGADQHSSRLVRGNVFFGNDGGESIGAAVVELSNRLAILRWDDRAHVVGRHFREELMEYICTGGGGMVKTRGAIPFTVRR